MRKFCILAVLCLAVTVSGCKKEGNEQPCPGPEVSSVANAAEGEYYARKFSKGDEYCYCVRVTAVGYDAWGLVDAWNENLSMLLYSAESCSGKGDIKIPAGTYRIGAAGETEAGTVSRDESYFRTVESDGDNSTSYYFEEEPARDVAGPLTDDHVKRKMRGAPFGGNTPLPFGASGMFCRTIRHSAEGCLPFRTAVRVLPRAGLPDGTRRRWRMPRRPVGDGAAHAAIFFATFVGR